MLPKARVPGYLIMLVNSLLRPLHSSSSRTFKTLNDKWPLRRCPLHLCSTGMIKLPPPPPPPPPPSELHCLIEIKSPCECCMNTNRLNHVNNDFSQNSMQNCIPGPYLHVDQSSCNRTSVAGQRLFWKARMCPIPSACLTVLQCFNLIW